MSNSIDSAARDDKQQAVDRLHRYIGLAEEPLGPGSKEHKSTFLAIARALEVPVSEGARKPEIAASICRHFGGEWDETCVSAGDTITLVGINRIVQVVEGSGMHSVSGAERKGGVGRTLDGGDPGGKPTDGDGDSELQLAVAEQIAQLSQAADTPTEFEATSVIEVADIDLRAQSWMTSLIAVQGWLRLPQDLSMKDPALYLENLAEGLGFETAASAFEALGNQPRLNDAGLDRLSGRLQRAILLQQDFLADLETDGGTLASATGRWREAWDEEEAEEDEGSGPVTARAHTWNINEFSDRALRGKLNLSPSYQRGDVWPTSDSQMLIESILRGIPLPSVIILKSEEDAPYEVVDGKQRLTSILRFIGKHPKAIETIRSANERFPDAGLADLFENDYPKFRRKWKAVTGEALTATKEREYYFPFQLRTKSIPLQGELSDLQGKYYTEIKGSRVNIADSRVEVRELFEMVTDYKVPLIEYSKASRRQIHEVFNLYNKQGKHLNAEEIRNALFHDIAFMRALMVASGDIDKVEEVAPFLLPNWTTLEAMSSVLEGFGIGTARYRRTKVLSWLAAMLFVDSIEGGRPRRLSTAKHIDFLLGRIELDGDDPFRNGQTINEALLLIMRGMKAHADVKRAFSPNFRDTKTGTKWQELQLVASLLGICLAAAVLEEKTADRLAFIATELGEKTAAPSWQRPRKTQTGTQWEYIARIALDIVDVMGVNRFEASEALARRFGYSCIPTLELIVAGIKSP